MPHKGRKSRPLGSVRRSLQSVDNLLKLPPLTSPSHSLDTTYAGIHGNALSITLSAVMTGRAEPEPQPRVKTPPVTSGRNTSSSRSADSKSDDSAGLGAKKELLESLEREKLLKTQIDAQQKTLADLREELKHKVREKQALETRVDKSSAQELHYKELYVKEVELHAETRTRLTTLEDALFARDREVAQLTLTQQETIYELNRKTELQILAVEKAKETEIAIREEKLKRLKQQMADSIQRKSWERQQQLDELSKELTRALQEVDMLRLKLKATTKTGAKPDVERSANYKPYS